MLRISDKIKQNAPKKIPEIQKGEKRQRLRKSLTLFNFITTMKSNYLPFNYTIKRVYNVICAQHFTTIF